jgi:hypothetical protein
MVNMLLELPWTRLATSTRENRRNTSAIGIRQLRVERHVEDNFFFERNQMANVYMLTLKRKTFLVGFLITICQLAVVDTMNFLPAGTILYAFGVTLALELMSDADGLLWIDGDEEERQRQKILRQQRADLSYHMEAARFEYHVLKGKPNVEIVPMEDKSGRVTLFAIG